MKVLIDKPFDVNTVEFRPRIVGQTTLYQLDEQMRDTLLDLQKRYETDFRDVYMFDKETRLFGAPGPWTLLAQVSFDEDIKAGKIKLLDISPQEKVAKFSKDAREVYEALQDNLKPYREGMKPQGKSPVPELNWQYKIGKTLYQLRVEFSDDKKWLIASPEITLDIVNGKTRYDDSGKALSYHVQGPFEDETESYHDFERVFHALLTGNKIADERPRFLRMDYGILKVGVRPILASELRDKIGGVDAFLHRVLENKDLIYEAVQNTRKKIEYRPANLQRADECIRQISSSSGLENCLPV